MAAVGDRNEKIRFWGKRSKVKVVARHVEETHFYSGGIPIESLLSETIQFRTYFYYGDAYLFAACRSDHSLRRQLETIATLKLNAAELHQSQTSLSPINASVIIRCPLILIHFDKQFSTSGSHRRSKIKGDGGSRRPDVGDGWDKSGITVTCPSCGQPCTKTEIFMCMSHFAVITEAETT